MDKRSQGRPPKARSAGATCRRTADTGARMRGRPAVHSRDEIVRAAKAAFSQAGYANVTLDHLAARLKTRKGTLYYHSTRKVDLLIAISRELIGASIAELRRIAKTDAPADVRFAAAMRFHMTALLADQQAAKVYFENESDLPPRIRTELRRVLREIQEILAGLVREGVEAGLFEGDPAMAAKHALAVCAWPYRWYSPRGRLGLPAFVDGAVTFVLSALRGGARQSAAEQTDRRKTAARG